MFRSLLVAIALAGTLGAQDLAEVERLRGLEATGPVRVEVVGREALARTIEAELDRRLPPERIEAMRRTLVAFGLAPAGIELRPLLLDLWAGGLEGYYDRATQTAFLVEGAPGAVRVHELVHALDHQHHDVEALARGAAGDCDAELALTALLEGTATDAMVRHALGDRLAANDDLALAAVSGALAVDRWARRGAGGEGEDVRRLREFLLALHTSPNRDGLAFVRALRRDGGAAALERAFAEPPVSTEQVLHPERWLVAEPERPEDVAVPDLAAALGEGFAAVETNRMGELAIRELVRHRLRGGSWFRRGPDAAGLAAGWAGDAYRVHAREETLVLAWRTRWDSEADASEFAAAIRRLYHLVRLEGRTVDVVHGAPAGRRAAIEAALAGE